MEIKRKCIWCGREVEDSPRDICWQCMRNEDKEEKRLDEIVTVGMMESYFRSKSAAFLGSLGGKVKSAKKSASSKRNGKLGGRPILKLS